MGLASGEEISRLQLLLVYSCVAYPRALTNIDPQLLHTIGLQRFFGYPCLEYRYSVKAYLQKGHRHSFLVPMSRSVIMILSFIF
jgi:hypothetical protein